MRRAVSWVAEHEFWLLWVYGVPLLFASNLPAWVFASALATIPSFWLARKITRGHWSFATPLDLPLRLLLALGLVAVLVSNDRSSSLQLYGELVGGIALYYGIVNGLPRAQISKGVWLLLGLGVAMGILGVLGLRYAEKFLPLPLLYDALPKLDLTRLNPRGFTANIVAGAVAPVVPVAFAWARVQTGTMRVGAFAGALLLSLIVVLTQSRGALLGLGIGLVVLSVWRFPRLLWLVPLVVVLALGVTWWFRPAKMAELLLVSDPSESAVGRLELWNRALLMLRDFPFTGIGLGTFQPTVLTLYPLFQNNPGQPVPHAHNLYLQMGVDYGVGGLVAFIGLVVTVLFAGMQRWRASHNKKRDWLAGGLLAGYVVYLTHALLDAVALSTKVNVVIWFIVALLMILHRSEAVKRAGKSSKNLAPPSLQGKGVGG
jgi:putative inorganic carbon (HCO3(-)) transporter